MEIRRLDPQDQAAVRRHWELGHAASRVDRPYDLYWPWESAWVHHSSGQARTDTRSVLLGAFTGSELRGAGQLDLPLHDNPHLVFAQFFVDPAHQRQGIGTALVEAGCELVRRERRRVLLAEAYAPPGEDSASLRFARSLGFTEAIEDGMKVLDLAATEQRWHALGEQATPHHTDYRFVTWHDTVPDALVDGYCRLNEAFVDEMPKGELDVEAEKWDEHRVREREQRNRQGGRHCVTTAARAAEGEVAGLTEVVFNAHTPWRGMQSGTLVMPAHRGHRLGLAMKLVNQRAVREAYPGIEVLFTGNAGVNAPMNAINDLLGYRLVERCVEVQKSLA